MPVIQDRSGWCLPALLEDRATRLGDQRLVGFDLGLASPTYAEAWHESQLIAALAERGVGPGDTVAIMLRNRAEFVLTWFATNLLGAAQAPVNVDLRGAFLEHVLNTAGCRVAVVQEDLQELVLDCTLEHLERLVALDQPRDSASLQTEAFADLDAAAAVTLPAVTPRDIAAVLFTSGTTGPAKGAEVVHDQAHLLAERAQEIL